MMSRTTSADARTNVTAAAVSCVPLVLMVAFVVATLMLVGHQALPGVAVSCVGYVVLAIGALWICGHEARRWHLLWLVVPSALLALQHGYMIMAHLRSVDAARSNVPVHPDSIAPATITGISLVAVGLATGTAAVLWSYCVLKVLFLRPIHTARLRKGQCGECGYDRAGLADGAACPECGASDRS